MAHRFTEEIKRFRVEGGAEYTDGNLNWGQRMFKSVVVEASDALTAKQKARLLFVEEWIKNKNPDENLLKLHTDYVVEL